MWKVYQKRLHHGKTKAGFYWLTNQIPSRKTLGQRENQWKHKWVVRIKYSSNDIFRIGDKNPLEAFFEKHQINQLEIIQNLTQRANAES